MIEILFEKCIYMVNVSNRMTKTFWVTFIIFDVALLLFYLKAQAFKNQTRTMSFFLSFSFQTLMVPKTVPNFILIIQFKTRAFQRRVNHLHTTNTLKSISLQKSTILHTFCQYYLKHIFKDKL